MSKKSHFMLHERIIEDFQYTLKYNFYLSITAWVKLLHIKKKHNLKEQYFEEFVLDKLTQLIVFETLF